jgi:hypothetical protein
VGWWKGTVEKDKHALHSFFIFIVIFIFLAPKTPTETQRAP